MTDQQCATPNGALPKATYFNAAARGLALRVALFKAFGKDGWIDHRIKFADWPALKPNTPLGSLPTLTIAGQDHVQTDALVRWAGQKAGLYPRDDDDQALLLDEVMATSLEALSKTPPSKTDEEKKRLREEYAAGFLTTALTFLQQKVGHGPFVTGADLSVADLVLYSVTDMIVIGQFDHVPASLVLEGFPGLAAHHEAVKSHKLYQDYLSNYPN